jgi:hypothetical protein
MSAAHVTPSAPNTDRGVCGAGGRVSAQPVRRSAPAITTRTADVDRMGPELIMDMLSDYGEDRAPRRHVLAMTTRALEQL